MRVLECDHMSKIIEEVIPASIMELNPVIAGGFVFALYKNVTYIMNNGTEKEKQTVIYKIKESMKTGGFGFAEDRLVRLSELREVLSKEGTEGLKKFATGNLSLSFGDIDLWFHKKDIRNPFVSELKTESNLISTVLSALKNGRPDKIDELVNKKLYTHDEVSAMVELLSELKRGNYSLTDYMFKSSVFANTFHIRESGHILNMKEVQFIKKPIDSIKELLNSFDISSIAVAYYQGKIYLLDDVDRSIEAGVMKVSSKIEDLTLYRKLFSYGRMVKYHSRYKFKLEDGIGESMLNSFIEADQLIKECNAFLEGSKNEREMRSTVEKWDSYIEEIFGTYEGESLSEDSITTPGASANISSLWNIAMAPLPGPTKKDFFKVKVKRILSICRDAMNQLPTLYEMSDIDKNSIFYFIDTSNHMIKAMIKNLSIERLENKKIITKERR